MENEFFISICIPSYNRPSGLQRLLKSIDSTRHVNDLQIVICEDNAPKRSEVRGVVDEYKKESPYQVKYIENPVNFGHGKNWRQCSNQADGEFLIYMGDDDDFIPGALDPFIDWVKEHRENGYILRAYRILLTNDKTEYFKYYSNDTFFEPGEKAYTEFFLKSMLMSGYTVRREYANQFTEDCLDSTLYFQMYLEAEVCLKYPSAYCNIPIAQYIGDGVSYFGTNVVEKAHYTPGVNNVANLKCFANVAKITKYIDDKYGLNSTDIIKIHESKYSSFSTMIVYRHYGIKQYIASCKELRKIGLDCTPYFNIYYISILLFGANLNLFLVRMIKKIIGRRLHL
jgi:abequosyltransferase